MISIVKKLLLWFYCIDIPAALLLFAVATAVFLLEHSRLGRNGWWKWMLGLALLCWMLMVSYTTILARNGAGQVICSMSLFHSYREVISGGSREILRSNFMNAALFYPAGLIGAAVLPRKWPIWIRCVIPAAALAAMSIGIESIQFCFALGRCEVDDVLHNALGGFLGCLISGCAAKFFPARNS